MSETLARDTFDPPVFITDALQRRPPRKTDYLREKQALQDLAGRMIDQPAEVLPRFVDLAMEMTDGIAAGISLYEENPAPGVFRWQYLRGALERFNGATTPRNFSPCGITLDSMAPVLTCHSERMYDWIAQAGIIAPEVLLVPLYLGGTKPLGTLWIVSDQEEHFDSGHARVMTELATFVGIALRMLQTENQLKQALEQQEMLATEMHHRVKNAFALIDGMIRVSKKGASTPEEMAERLSGRVRALDNAQALIRRNPGAPSKPASDLETLLRTILHPFDQAAFSLNGPRARISDHALSGVALLFHELATNAAKYGALKVEAGRIDINWRIAGDHLVIHWTEHGGPSIHTPPTTSGFGSRLVQTTVKQQFQGALDSQWSHDGLRATITLSLKQLQDPLAS